MARLVSYVDGQVDNCQPSGAKSIDTHTQPAAALCSPSSFCSCGRSSLASLSAILQCATDSGQVATLAALATAAEIWPTKLPKCSRAESESRSRLEDTKRVIHFYYAFHLLCMCLCACLCVWECVCVSCCYGAFYEHATRALPSRLGFKRVSSHLSSI